MRTDRFSFPIVVALSAACGGNSATEPGDPPSDAPVASVSVDPGERTAAPGDTFTLVAIPRDTQGKTLSGRSVTWLSLNPTAATVSAAGLVEAKSAGAAIIKATVEGKSGSAQVTVEEPVSAGPVATVDVNPSSAAIEEGELFRLYATPRNAAGKEVTGPAIQWISEDPSIAYVTPGGEVWALRPGRVTITASTEGKSGSATVEIWANFGFDLLYDGWSGVPGVGPELFIQDIRHADAGPLPIAAPGYGGTGDPTPSPDGSRIAFVRYNSYGDTDVFVVNRDGTDLAQLTNDRAFDDQPAWSPDGQRIAFRRWPQGTGPDIWVMDAGDGGNAMNLTSQENVSQNSPAWSPLQIGGGYRIAYVQAENGEAHIWSMKADGTDRRQITGGPFYDDQPSWSPNGSTIAFQRNGAAVFGDIYLVDAGGGNERWLVSLPFGQFAPAWSPDGKLIAFASKHESGEIYQIYTVRLDGRPVARRTSDTFDKRNPVWIVR